MSSSNVWEFVSDLRKHAEQLRAENRRIGSKKLAEFRSFRYGEDDAYLPLDARGLPWRKHVIAVSRGELTQAGYEDYCRGWKCAAEADPWRHVRWGGEVPLWHWGVNSAEHETRLRRAKLLERIADVVELRAKPNKPLSKETATGEAPLGLPQPAQRELGRLSTADTNCAKTPE